MEETVRSIDLSRKLEMRHIFLMEIIQQEFLCTFCSNESEFKKETFRDFRNREFNGFNITKKGLELLVNKIKAKKERRIQALENYIHMYGKLGI